MLVIWYYKNLNSHCDQRFSYHYNITVLNICFKTVIHLGILDLGLLALPGTIHKFDPQHIPDGSIRNHIRKRPFPCMMGMMVSLDFNMYLILFTILKYTYRQTKPNQKAPHQCN